MTDTTSGLLDEMERDALTELINIGVSRAAANLRTMINHEVLLSVPSVAIATRADAARAIGQQGSTRLVAVRQTFEGDFHGRAMLIFPEVNSLELVRAVTGGTLPLEDIEALEQEALAETGNVILNSCLATIANMLLRSLRMSLPEILRGSGLEIFERSVGTGPDDVVLLIHINFSVNAREIRGYIAMLMDLPALRALKELLHDLIRRATVAAPSTGHAGP
jgi:chemotaxis protein CheC